MVSLRTSDANTAAERYAEQNRLHDALVEGFESGDRVKELKAISDTLGIKYTPVDKRIAMPEDQKFADAVQVLQLWKDKGKPEGDEAEAIFGYAKDHAKFSDYFDFYIRHHSSIKQSKTPDEYRKWLNPRKKWVREFIEAQGDLPIEKLTPEEVYVFKLQLLDRISEGRIVASTASKAGTYLRGIFECRNTELQLGLQNPFVSLSFKGEVGKRSAITTDQIKGALLKDGFLNGLNTEAKNLLLLMINTGLGPKEAIGLLPDDIKLNDNIPHIIIRRNEIRNLKTGYRERSIPLVGVSLEAIRQFPEGYPKYRKDGGADKLSACLNKYLNEHCFFKEDQSLYSIRHAFKDRMREAGFEDSLMRELMGHSEIGPRYGEGYSLSRKLVMLNKIEI